jgi:elongation factor G
MALQRKGAVIGGLNPRREMINNSEDREDNFTAVAEIALNDMFEYSTRQR